MKETALHRSILQHSLFWLCFANLIGVTLALFIQYPELNTLTAPVTYGRLIPLHLNFHLYGWCSIPLIGILYHYFIPSDCWESKYPRIMLMLWSVCLAIGGFSWVTGVNSGKIFLEWSGYAEFIFVAVMIVLWAFLSLSYRARNLHEREASWNIKTAKIAFLFVLFLVPIVFYRVLSPDIFPPINVLSSGATGASLLISSLGVVAILLLFADTFGEKSLAASNFRRYVYAIFISHIVLWFVLNHSNSSHYDIDQEVGLISFGIWLFGTPYYYSLHKWNSATKIWLKGLLFWSIVLIPTAILTFLPGNLEVAKFTSYIVAHVHIAMAGVYTCLLMCILTTVPHGNLASRVLSSLTAFYIWNVGLVLHLVALLGIAFAETENAGIFIAQPAEGFVFYTMRTVSGLILLSASLFWFCRSTIISRELNEGENV